MAAPAKFLFDTDFSAPDRARERATAAEVAQKVAAAEARAYRDGYDAALREAKVESDRRVALADWLLQRSNPFFARAMVNRIWYHLMGRGIVEPVEGRAPRVALRDSSSMCRSPTSIVV